ncbi:MAG: NAD(P)/FAD-dependent oxidoreductase [Bacillota bacterium]
MSEQEVYDIAVVGGGPAGLSAAVNAWVRRKKAIVFGGHTGRSKVNLSPRVDNYLGFPGIGGNDLYERFHRHVEEFKIPLVAEKVQNIYPMEGVFTLQLKDTAYQCRAVIVTVGVAAQKILDGEEEYIGRGVSYCATCDGPLFQGKTVTVIDYTGEGAEEARFMADFCSSVYYMAMTKSVPEFKNTRIEVVAGDQPVEITGDGTVKALKTRSRAIETDGIFIFRETSPPSELIPGLEVEGGAIRVNRKMETSIRGIYAAGDCTGKPYQVAKSVGEGQTAALNAVSFIDSLEISAP